MRRRIPRQGDVYWIDPNAVAGREMRDRHRWVVITPEPISRLGVCITVPVTSGGAVARSMGICVAIFGHDTSGVAVCNQVRTFDIAECERAQGARYIESLDTTTTQEIVARVVSVIEAE